MRVVYLASPIDQDSGQANGLRAMARVVMTWLSMSWYDPAQAFTISGLLEVGAEVGKINRVALGQCEGLLALVPGGTATIGVIQEIEQAKNQGMPVAIVSDLDSWSLHHGPGWDGRVKRFDPRAQTGGGEGISGSWSEAIEQAAAWLSVQEPDGAIQGLRPLPFKVEDGAQLPTRAYPDDAGLDLYVSDDVVIPAGQFRDVPCGVAVQMESYHWGLIIGRSSTLRQRGLMVAPGIIDPGYRGELFAGVYNLGGKAQTVCKDDRLAQLILMSNQTQAIQPVAVEQLSQSLRGSNGFGSSGT